MTDLSLWLTKPDAAARLGISERTLERLCARGEGPELRNRPRPGRKPEAVCNPEDVERLAAAKPHVMAAAAVTEQRIWEYVGLAPRLAEPAPRPPALYLTLQEASAYTGLSVALLRRLIRAGKLASIRDRAVKVRRADCDRLADAGAALK